MTKDNLHKVNIKARIDRHSRAIKENLKFKSRIIGLFQKKINWGQKIIIFIILLMLPVYPMFAGIINNSNEYNFYRQYIDEDSILFSYDNPSIEELSSGDIFESNEEFVLDNSILDEQRNYSGENKVRTYKVKLGDSISLIASKFGVSKDTIYEYNNFSKNHILRPGETLKIPPVSGIPYKVKKGDTLLSIANKYKIDKEKIIKYNNLEGKVLKVGQEILLPGAKRIVPKKTYVTHKTYTRKTYSKISNFKNKYISNSSGWYKLRWHKPYSGAWGNCTYYVASYKNVDWRGNANQWMRNAAKKGHKVVWGRGFRPQLGAIIVFSGRGYNPYYGHVGIVMALKKDYMIISDMNYRRLNEVTYRKIKYNDRAIVGYIYVGPY